MNPSPLSSTELASLTAVVENIEKNNKTKNSKALQRLHIVTILSSASILTSELITGGEIGEFFRVAKYDQDFTYFGMAYLIGLFVLMVFSGVMIIRSQARKEQTSMEAFLERFEVVRGGTILSELFLMLLFLLAVIGLGKGIWIGPLLTLFTGNFLLQRHLFQFSFRNSLALGILCYLISGILFAAQVHSLIIPFVVFVSLSIFSLRGLRKTEGSSHA